MPERLYNGNNNSSIIIFTYYYCNKNRLKNKNQLKNRAGSYSQNY